MVITFISVLIIYLLLTRVKVNSSPEAVVRQVVRLSKYEAYEQYIVNQANLESGYFTNTLSQPPINNPFSMSAVRIRPTTQIDTYSNPAIDGGQLFGVYEDIQSAAEDFILYLEYIRMPEGLTCKEYNAYIVSKNYAVDPLYQQKLNNMCR